VDARRHPRGRVVALLRLPAVAAALGREDDLVAPPLQRAPEPLLRQRAAVVRGDVEEIDAAVDRQVNRAQPLLEIGGAELVPERGGAVADDADLQAGVAERAVVHGSRARATDYARRRRRERRIPATPTAQAPAGSGTACAAAAAVKEADPLANGGC